MVKFSQAGQLLQVFATAGLFTAGYPYGGVAVDPQFRVWVAGRAITQFNPDGSVGVVLTTSVGGPGLGVDSDWSGLPLRYRGGSAVQGDQ